MLRRESSALAFATVGHYTSQAREGGARTSNGHQPTSRRCWARDTWVERRSNRLGRSVIAAPSPSPALEAPARAHKGQTGLRK